MAALLAAALLVFAYAPTAQADDWDLKDSNGTHYQLSSLHGKWVLVNFWAPWCPPCLQEIPELAALQKREKDLQVIGVAVMYHSIQSVTEMIKKQAIPYPVVLGNEDTASDFGGLTGLPTSFLYSPAGRLVGHHQGPLTRQEVEQAMHGHGTAFAP